MSEFIWDVTEPDHEHVRSLQENSGLTRATAHILARQKLSPEDLPGFLNPALRDLSDPFALPGTLEASERLWKAIHGNERILIHGDYDTDGITASALLSWTLRRNGANVDCFLPHRIENGYGLTAESVKTAAKDGYSLLVTVDCGITSYDAARTADRYGIDLIITDHHTPGEEEPRALAVINPKLPRAPLPTRDLAGVGVAFKLCHAFIKYGRNTDYGGHDTDLRHGFDLVALGTVADIVPLMNENRILVKYGMSVLEKQQRPGIHALCEVAGIQNPFQASDIAFRLAPRLNATGRIGDATDSLKLLQADSMSSAFELARSLDNTNQERRKIEKDVLEAAETQIEEMYAVGQNRSIIVSGKNWHLGVVGIVASHIVRRYHRPTIVLTRDPSGKLTGSARSVDQVDLVDVLGKCSDRLVRFGGHAMAAGLSLAEPDLEFFRKKFDQVVSRLIGREAVVPRLEISAVASFSELAERFFAELQILEPFGEGNPEPVFVTHGVHPEDTKMAGKSHTRGTVRDSSCRSMSFIAFGKTPDQFPPPPWSLAYTPQLNHYAGRSTPQIKILDIKQGKPRKIREPAVAKIKTATG